MLKGGFHHFVKMENIWIHLISVEDVTSNFLNSCCPESNPTENSPSQHENSKKNSTTVDLIGNWMKTIGQMRKDTNEG